jgi:hypothetical protein
MAGSILKNRPLMDFESPLQFGLIQSMPTIIKHNGWLDVLLQQNRAKSVGVE